jgi:hypothetical protein
MGMFTQILRDLEQIVFPDRDQHPIPAMDGALTPNDLLDHIRPIGAPIPGADDVAIGSDGALYVSAGREILRLSGEEFGERSVFATLDGTAGGLAFHPDGRLLVCVAGIGLAAIGRDGRQSWLNQVGDQPLHCLTDVAAAPDGTIFLAEGSTRNAPENWLRDLMEKNKAGRLLSCGPAFEEAQVILEGLQFPYGLAFSQDAKTLWFTESWSHRLSRAPIIGRTLGPAEVVMGNMPGYPARLSRSAGGGFWLSQFAVRTHLVEFVLREDDFREEMIRTIPPEFWIGPALATTNDCREPMQLGNVKALGIEKPWAPPRSYGLVVRVDEDGDVLASLHSRRGGRHHGITAVCETPQGLVIVSKGSGQILLDSTRSRA